MVFRSVARCIFIIFQSKWKRQSLLWRLWTLNASMSACRKQRLASYLCSGDVVRAAVDDDSEAMQPGGPGDALDTVPAYVPLYVF